MPIPNIKGKISKLTAKDKIYNTVCDWIVRGTLKPEEKINESELAEFFDVSRTPVHEAMMLLKMQKLVDILPGKSTVVTDLSFDVIEQSYVPLAELQALAVRLACKNMTEKQIEKFKKMEKELNENKFTPEEFLELDAKFHSFINQVANNEYITSFSNTLLLHINRVRFQYFVHYEMIEISKEEHLAMLKALIALDSEKASDLMRKHWINAKNRSLELLKLN